MTWLYTTPLPELTVQPMSVDPHERQLCRQVDHYHVGGKALLEAAQHRAGDLVQRRPVALQGDRAAFQARHFEDLRHQLGHVAGLGEDALREGAALVGAEALAALGEAAACWPLPQATRGISQGP